MMKSNLSSRSTFFSSQTVKSSSTKKKKKFKKTIPERVPLTATQILARNAIKDIIEHAIQIADFHIKHKINQRTYENRKVKKEQIFINKDELFKGSLPQDNKDYYNWTFISKLIGKIIFVDSEKNLLQIYNFNTESEEVISFNFLFDKKKKIISAELYEHEKSKKCYLLLLYQDFTFFVHDLFLLNKEGKNIYTEEDKQIFLNRSKISEFNLKPYLNIPNIKEYFPDYQNGIKVIIFPKSLNDWKIFDF